MYSLYLNFRDSTKDDISLSKTSSSKTSSSKTSSSKTSSSKTSSSKTSSSKTSSSKTSGIPVLNIDRTGTVLYFTGRQWEACRVIRMDDSFLVKTRFSINQYDLDSLDLTAEYFVVVPKNFPLVDTVISQADVHHYRKLYQHLN